MVLRNPSSGATRQALVQVAAAEILEKGFRGCSLDHILDKAGVTKGALYYYFSSKQDLGFAVLDEVYSREVMDAWTQGLRRTDNPVDDLLAMLKSARTSACAVSVRCGCPLNNLAQEMASVDEAWRLRIEGIFEAWRQAIVDALDRGKGRGTVRSGVNSRTAAIFITSLIEGATGAAKNARDPSIKASALEALEMFVQTLRPHVSLRQ